jgi:protein transport protein SEC61 subunit gamma and related proteins
MSLAAYLISLPVLTIVQRKVVEVLQTLKLAKKTSKEDYTTHLRLVLLSIGAVGGVGFIIKLIAEFVTFGGGRQ